jgi:hypothetical protein
MSEAEASRELRTITSGEARRLQKAARAKGMRHATFSVFSFMVRCSQSGRWPATRAALVTACRTTPWTFNRVTTDLAARLWITPVRGGGRGNPTRYAVQEGEPWPRKVPQTDAERMRDYRARLREKAASVTSDTRSEAQTVPAGGVPVSRERYEKIVTQSGPSVTTFSRNADPKKRPLTSGNGSVPTYRG